MSEISNRKGINQIVLVDSRLFFFILQTFHTKTTSVAIWDAVIRTFLSRRYRLLLRKIKSFDQLFSREILRTFVTEWVNMGIHYSGIRGLVFSLCYTFALTSTSLSERPFLYDNMGGSLRI